MGIVEEFTKNAQRASNLLDNLRANGFSPLDEKPLKSWSQAQVAKLLNVKPPRLSELIKKGVIPSGTLRANKRRFFTIQEINEIRAYLATTSKKHDKFSFFRERKESQVIGVANFKGGVGKSTVAVTMAHDLCLRGYRTLFVDLDGQGSATTLFGLAPDEDVEPEETIAPFVESFLDTDRFDGFKPRNLAYACRDTNWGDGLKLIPANLWTGHMDIALSNIANESDEVRFFEVLKLGLDTIRHNFDVIIIDFPPSLGYSAINGVYASDSLIVPMPPDMLDFTSATSFFLQLADIARTLVAYDESFDMDFVKMVLTKSPGLGKGSAEELLNGADKGAHKNAKTLKALMATAFGGGLLQNEYLFSEAFKEASTNFRSVLELEPGDMKCTSQTLQRALDSVRSVHDEIESLIQDVFENRVYGNRALEVNHG
ncbi:MAG: hypothetical protein C9356_15610 [Oleiphilus sp.]|nr:MAG: hypothetical protein C9356_15610 [Oleiphilus sp.]